MLVMVCFPAMGQSPARVEKRISKNIEATWPDMEISRVPEVIPDEVMPDAQGGDKGNLYRLFGKGDFIGLLLLTSAKGRYDYFDYMVLYDTSLRIIMVDILVYRSDHGFEIMNKGWLKQFKGSDGCDLEYGKDIDAISGATFSASSITKNIRTWCSILKVLIPSD